MDYDLSRLSPRSFEQLVQALAAAVIGPAVVVFGDGPDGGREATFEGREVLAKLGRRKIWVALVAKLLLRDLSAEAPASVTVGARMRV